MQAEAASLPVEAVEKLLSAAEARGVARQRLAPPAAGGGIAFALLCALYERAAVLSGDDALGLHVGEGTSARMYGALGYIAANSESLGEALASLTDYQPLWTDAAGVALRKAGPVARLHYWHKDAIPPEGRRQESEQMLAALLAFVREAAGLPLNPLEVRFEHRAPDDLGEHRRIFAAPLVFGATATELVLDASVLALPLPGADATLAALIRAQAEPALADRKRRAPFVDQLHARLREAISSAQPIDLPALASALNLGLRALQRRLRRHGLTYRAVTEEVRIKLAKELLAEPTLALAQIAFRLGYSQTSAFHRAFRRHTGTPPGAYRRALTAAQQRFAHG